LRDLVNIDVTDEIHLDAFTGIGNTICRVAASP
jgi:hypothetical protein